MKVIILSGFLGTGKTSFLMQLVNHLVEKHKHEEASVVGCKREEASVAGCRREERKEASVAGCRREERKEASVAIIENEIGRVSVDSATLGSFGFEYRELISGCACCSIAGEFEETLTEIERELNPKWVIIEATGLAYPDKLIESTKASVITLESLQVFVLVDAARFLLLQKVSPLIAGQIQFADFLLLNKADLVDDEAKKEVTQRLEELNGKSQIIEVVATAPIEKSVMNTLTNPHNELP